MAIDGPYYEDLQVGWSHQSGGHTVTAGHVGVFQALAGDQNPTHLESPSARPGDGEAPTPVSTALTAHVAIAQSTRATREVVANLEYREVVFPRPVPVGTILSTRVRVIARERARARPDRPPRGKVLLRIESEDQDGNLVLKMERLALVRARAHEIEPPEGAIRTGADHPVDTLSAATTWGPTLHRHRPSSSQVEIEVGATLTDHLVEPVTDPLALVRLTGNEARAHRSAAFGQAGKRLVYGGHTQSLAQAALSRLIDDRHVVLAWHRCEHPHPVFEGDELVTAATVRSVRKATGGRLVVFDVTTRVTNREADVTVQSWTAEALVPAPVGMPTD